MMDIKVELLQWYTFFDKIFSGRTVKNKNIFDKNQQKNYPNQLLEILIKEKCTHLL